MLKRVHPASLIIFLVAACHVLIISSLVLSNQKSQVSQQSPVLAASIIQLTRPAKFVAEPVKTPSSEPKRTSTPIPPKPEPKPEPKQTVLPVPVSEPEPEPEPEPKQESKAPASEKAPEAPQEPDEQAEIFETPTKTTATEADMPAPQQFVATQVDVQSQQNHPPVYPKLSKRLKEQGTVTLKLSISASGVVEHISIEHSSGFGRLDQAAINAAEKWQYLPATLDGVPIAQVYLMPIEFKLQ